MPTKKKRYQYQLRVGTADDGQPIRKAFYSYISLEDAHRKAEEWLAEQENSNKTGHDLCQWVENWMVTYKKGAVSERTYITGYEVPYRLYIKPYFSGRTIEEIKPIHLQEFFNTIDRLSDSYLTKIRFLLRQAFVSASDNGLLEKNPMQAGLNVNSKTEKKPRKVLSDEQIRTVNAELFYRKPIIPFILETGLRIGEACGLMWKDIKGDYFKVDRSLAQRKVGSEIIINPPKKNSYRIVPLTDSAKNILASLPKNSEYVFGHKDGEPARPCSESVTIARVMRGLSGKYTGLPAVTAHELRHTYGTALRRRGVDIYTIQKILGHKDIQVTARLYVHNEADVLVENALSIIGKGISGDDDK